MPEHPDPLKFTLPGSAVLNVGTAFQEWFAF